jgi:hypothetical protein
LTCLPACGKLNQAFDYFVEEPKMSDASPPRARDGAPAHSLPARGHRPPRLDPAIIDFYSRYPRRARSRERDLGLRWRAHDGSTYRAAWIVDTGELYSVRHGGPAEPDRVTILARVDATTLNRELDGWREVCDAGEPGSYEWLRERARAADASSARVSEPAPAAA